MSLFSSSHAAAAYRPDRMQIYKQWFCLNKTTKNKTNPKSTRELFVIETVVTGNGATRCCGDVTAVLILPSELKQTLNRMTMIQKGGKMETIWENY